MVTVPVGGYICSHVLDGKVDCTTIPALGVMDGALCTIRICIMHNDECKNKSRVRFQLNPDRIVPFERRFFSSHLYRSCRYPSQETSITMQEAAASVTGVLHLFTHDDT